MLVYSHFQISPEGFSHVQIWAPALLLKSILQSGPEPTPCSIGSSAYPQSEVQSALELAVIIVPVDTSFLDPDCLPVSVAKVYPHPVMLPPPGFIVGIAPSRRCPFSSRHDLWDSGQDFRLCLIRELCSWSESPSGGFGQTGCPVPFTQGCRY